MAPSSGDMIAIRERDPYQYSLVGLLYPCSGMFDVLALVLVLLHHLSEFESGISLPRLHDTGYCISYGFLADIP